MNSIYVSETLFPPDIRSVCAADYGCKWKARLRLIFKELFQSRRGLLRGNE